MQHVEVTRTIKAPVDIAWDRYTDHRGWTDWAGLGTVTLEQQGAGDPNGVGCVRRITNMGVSIAEEILTFDRPKRMTYRLIRGPVPIKNHLGEVLFSETEPGRCQIVWRCRFDSTIPLVGGLVERYVARMFGTTLDRLVTRGGL
jgi:uncharacterized protein YndB with AHSA1/START domain